MGFESDVSVREVDEDTWELVEPLVYVGNNDRFVVWLIWAPKLTWRVS